MMPSHEEHRRITKLLLGKEYPEVHSHKDAPVKKLGSRHRILRHDPLTNLALAAKSGDPGAFVAGALHDVTDAVDSAMNLAKRNTNPKKKRRRRRR